eukprot:TRINITY_DN2777_c0_g1_i1.p1 TRINITY_DN2777_c0_g1~~TRINITY_DN2777_c0_g1_i1.p1  ORF type:complete len:306 (+),score=56.69 TRINITY_DN2777_c0_g1_i1:44-919(+)
MSEKVQEQFDEVFMTEDGQLVGVKGEQIVLLGEATFEETSSESTDDSSFIVYDVHCANCSRILCSRGQTVLLIADYNTRLYSTDDVNSFVEEVNSPYKISTCECMIRDFGCKYCHKKVGYHVVKACYICLNSNNNGHYWMFNDSSVTTSPRKNEKGELITWGMLSSFEKEPTLLVNSEDEDYLCPICYEVFGDPTKLKCGHTFCKSCILRAIDLHKHCPLCRNPSQYEDISPNEEYSKKIEKIEIYCRYGCVKDTKVAGWTRATNKCNQIILYKDREQHEQACVHKDHKKT